MLGTDGEVVSSTRIRQALLAGAVEEAARMLDRPYELRGPVNLGDQRGVELGFPTANISVPDDRLIPGDGIYAAWAVVGEQEHQAAVNIGTRPTFAGADRRVEAHLLDWSGDLYGQSIAIRFIARIRAETKFESAEALAAQIAADVETAGQILEAAKVNPVPHEFGGLTRS
jgi:riboflavin kinase/FMN adenylyltransferase